jgi:hypothetical protein
LNNKYQLLVIDLDGTLVDARGKISAMDKKAIAAARAHGVTVALSTGRVITSSRGFIDELDLRGLSIFFDGALLFDLDRNLPVDSTPVKPDLLKTIVDYTRKNEVYLELYSIDRYFVEEINWADKIHREFFGIAGTLADFDDVIKRETILKCELMVHNDADEAKAQQFLGHFAARLRGSVARTPAYPDVRFINVVDLAVSKGAALEKLAAHLGIALERVMAIGDGSNDVPLLEKAGLAVAMGNARDELKAVADHVTLNIDNAGVAAAIERFLL